MPRVAGNLTRSCAIGACESGKMQAMIALKRPSAAACRAECDVRERVSRGPDHRDLFQIELIHVKRNDAACVDARCDQPAVARDRGNAFGNRSGSPMFSNTTLTPVSCVMRIASAVSSRARERPHPRRDPEPILTRSLAPAAAITLALRYLAACTPARDRRINSAAKSGGLAGAPLWRA